MSDKMGKSFDFIKKRTKGLGSLEDFRKSWQNVNIRTQLYCTMVALPRRDFPKKSTTKITKNVLHNLFFIVMQSIKHSKLIYKVSVITTYIVDGGLFYTSTTP